MKRRKAEPARKARQEKAPEKVEERMMSEVQDTPAAAPAEGAKPNGSTPPAPDTRTLQAIERRATLVGQILGLLLQSPIHRHLFISELEWRVIPPLNLGQCRLFKNKGVPFAFVTWAFVSDDVAGRLQAAPGRLQPHEWKCGPRQLIIDVVAPFGGAEACAREVLKSGAGAPAPAAAAPAIKGSP